MLEELTACFLRCRGELPRLDENTPQADRIPDATEAISPLSDCAESCANTSDLDLQRLVEVWPSLPTHIRQAILALVQSTGVRC